MNSSDLETLRTWITESSNIVFFGGAGVSTESGIPDFRSVDGLYHQKFDYPPETILSHHFFYAHTDYFYRFYREKLLAPDVEPNAAHKTLARWEREGKLRAVVTQNIDGLHQKAGAGMSLSCTARRCAITASRAENSTMRTTSCIPTACRTARAADSSSRTSCSMRRGSTSERCAARSRQSARRMC